MTKFDVPDQVFCLWGVDGFPVYHAIVAGEVVPATWAQKGAADAGLATEQRRAAARQTSINELASDLRQKIVAEGRTIAQAMNPDNEAGGDVAIPSKPKRKSDPKRSTVRRAATRARKAVRDRNADKIDGYDRDDLGESPDY